MKLSADYGSFESDDDRCPRCNGVALGCGSYYHSAECDWALFDYWEVVTDWEGAP